MNEREAIVNDKTLNMTDRDQKVTDILDHINMIWSDIHASLEIIRADIQGDHYADAYNEIEFAKHLTYQMYEWENILKGVL